MSKFKTKAEQSFEEKVQYHIEHEDWARVEEVTTQFETYEKLIAPMCEYVMVNDDEVKDLPVCKHHENNSRHDPDKGEHRPCLAIDPYPSEAPIDWLEHSQNQINEMELAASVERHPAGSQLSPTMHYYDDLAPNQLRDRIERDLLRKQFTAADHKGSAAKMKSGGVSRSRETSWDGRELQEEGTKKAATSINNLFRRGKS